MFTVEFGVSDQKKKNKIFERNCFPFRTSSETPFDILIHSDNIRKLSICIFGKKCMGGKSKELDMFYVRISSSHRNVSTSNDRSSFEKSSQDLAIRREIQKRFSKWNLQSKLN